MRSVVVMQLVLYERLVLDLRFPQYPIHVSTSTHTCSLSHTHTKSPLLQNTPVTALKQHEIYTQEYTGFQILWGEKESTIQAPLFRSVLVVE